MKQRNALHCNADIWHAFMRQIGVYRYIFICIYLQICITKYIYSWIYIYKHTYPQLNMHIYTYIHVYKYICMYIYYIHIRSCCSKNAPVVPNGTNGGATIVQWRQYIYIEIVMTMVIIPFRDFAPLYSHNPLYITYTYKHILT